MEYRVSGKYGTVELKTEAERYIVRARINKIRKSEYHIETNDREFALNAFAKFVGKVGADLTPDVIIIEITRNRKMVIHFAKTFQYGDGYEHIVPFSTITPGGSVEDVYIPVNGVVKMQFIRLQNNR